METTDSLVDLKEESPSQGQIGHLPPIKRDHESLDDFEHITKDVSPIKDATAQFLRHETGFKPKQEGDVDTLFQLGDFSEKNESAPFSHPGEEQLDDARKRNENIDILSDFSAPILEPSVDTVVDNTISSKNFMQYDDLCAHNNTSKSELEDFLQGEIDKSPKNSVKGISDDKRLHDSSEDISTGSDDILYKPGGLTESSKVPDIEPFGKSDNLIFEQEPVFKHEPTPEFKYEPEPEFKYEREPTPEPPKPKVEPPKPEPKPEPEEITPIPTKSFVPEVITPEPVVQETVQRVIPPQGDGLQVKDDVEVEASDNESAPDPLPRDYPEIGAFEAKAFLSAVGLDTWFHPERLNPKVEALVYWRDPKKSGIVFGSVLAVLLSLTLCSLISVVAYTSLLALIAAISFRIYKNILQAVQKTSEGHPFKEYLDLDLTLNPEKAREITDLAVVHINTAINELRRRFLVEDLIDSIKFGVLLWCLTYVGAWFNGLSLLIIAYVGLFTIPKVYENNKTQIDANIDIVKAKVNEVTDKIKAIIPIGKKPEEEKNKDE